MNTATAKPFLGFGLGLRTDHYQHILDHRPAVDWFEIISENFMVAGGKPRFYLHGIREHYPVVMHGVSLSIGTTDPLDMAYLRQLKILANDVQPMWISDHLCFTSAGGINSHDLLPLPYDEQTIRHVVDRVHQVQDFLGRRILLENVSSYLTYQQSAMEEWQFYTEIVERADCHMLLDINNIYVSARNHNFDPVQYLQGINPDRVYQFHLAGHTDHGDYIVDTHDHDVPDTVWDLYVEALKICGPISTMIERDDNIPAFLELFEELQHARQLALDTLPEHFQINGPKST